MNDDSKMEEVCGYLRMIERTRLLRNTTKELEELVGFSIGDNGLARKGGKSLFMKDAIFRELAHIVRQQTELDLQEVLDAYVAADKICERLGNVTDPALFCQHLVWHFYADAEATDDIADIINKVEPEQLPILVLLVLRLLPRLTAKGGDVKDITADYRHLFGWLSETVNKDLMMQKLPMLSQLEDEVRGNPGVMSRMHLIGIANQALNSYATLSTRKRISMSTKEMQECQFDPMVEGIWKEDELSTVFWQFERISNGYHLYRYEFDSNRRTFVFTKYFMRFFHQGNDMMALVIHPHAIRYLLPGKAMPNSLFAYLDCQIKAEDEQVETISFSPLTADGKWFALRQLKRSGKDAYPQNLLDDERYEKKDCHADDAYDFTLAIAAITSEHIYIFKDEDTYYKVPKSLNQLLDEVGFNSTVGVLSFSNPMCGQSSAYIAFDEFNLHYDVSTLEAMSEHQIEVVDTISA